MGSARGYLSFVLFAQWAYLLLLPLIIQAQPGHGLAGAYLAEETLSDHVAFKRAMVSAAREALEEFRGTEALSEEAVRALAGAAGPAGLPVMLADASEEQKSAYFRYLLITRKWRPLEKEWSRRSAFEEKITCSAGEGEGGRDIRGAGAGVDGWRAGVAEAPAGRTRSDSRMRGLSGGACDGLVSVSKGADGIYVARISADPALSFEIESRGKQGWSEMASHLRGQEIR